MKARPITINSLSIVLFHYFWKMQSDIWGIYNINFVFIMHISFGDAYSQPTPNTEPEIIKARPI